MSVLHRLLSAAGDRSEASNKAVARDALEYPEILDEVAECLDHRRANVRKLAKKLAQ